jgi:succinoglycan biosynthesis protein ExoM
MPMSGSQACGDEISQRRVSVCVATCGRPIGLANLLGALEVLEMPPGTTLQIVVVDNDSSESARAVCDEAAARHAYSLRYVVEKRRGIPFARNAALAVALSDSDFVAFIDDDETPESDWLAELLRVQEYYNADVVTGPCLPRYVEPPPSWIVDGAFHETPRHPTGTLRHVAFTHNALVRAAVFEIVDRYFDESMALNGGDDAEFFTRVFTAGFQIVWADNAIVRESIPASRSTWRWILQRGFRVGTSSAWIKLSHHSSTLPRQLAHSVYCMVKGTGIALLLPLRGRAAGAKGLQLFSYGLGRIVGSSGYLHQEYRVVHGT